MARLAGRNKRGLKVYRLAGTKVTTADLVTTALANGVAAAGANPTKAEYDVVVALVNDLKSKFNANVTLTNEIKADLNTVITSLAG